MRSFCFALDRADFPKEPVGMDPATCEIQERRWQREVIKQCSDVLEAFGERGLGVARSLDVQIHVETGQRTDVSRGTAPRRIEWLRVQPHAVINIKTLVGEPA